MESTERAATELMEVRFEGARRRIAVRSSDWHALQSQIPKSAHFRLFSAFKRFCAGCDNLPEQLFRRCTGSAYGRLEEFVADGVLGRRGTDDRFQTFFVTEVCITADAPPLAIELVAPRQAMLPLDVAVQQRGTE